AVQRCELPQCVLLDEQARARRAALAGIAKARLGQLLCRFVELGIVENDARAFASQFKRYTLETAGAPFLQQYPRFRGPRERQLVYARMRGDQFSQGGAGTRQYVQNAGRYAGLSGDFSEQQGRKGGV